MAWPEYRNSAPGAITLTHLKYFLADKQSIRSFGLLVILIGVYALGTHISLPFANIPELHRMIAQFPLLAILNDIFTGGAFGNVAPFTLGILTILFPFFKTVKVSGNYGNYSTNSATWWSLLIYVILSGGIVTWLAVTGIIPHSAIIFSGIVFYLFLGAICVNLLEFWLKQYWGVSIIALNALFVGLSYIVRLAINRSLLDIITGIFLIAFFISFGFLLRYAEEIHLLNIRNQEVQEGTLSIPASNNKLQMSFLLLNLLFVVIVTTLLNLFVPLKLNPFGNGLTNIFLFIIIQLVTFFLFFAINFVDEFFNAINSATIAQKLLLDYWIIPDFEVEEPTRIFLHGRITHAHRITYLFYLVWTILFSLLMLIFQFTGIPFTPVPFGTIVFLIVLTLCAQVIYEGLQFVHAYLQKVNYREFWTALASIPTISSLEFNPTTFPVKELIADLPGFTTEENNEIQRIVEAWEIGEISLKDLLHLLEIFRRVMNRLRNNPEQERVTIPGVLLKCGISLLLAVVFTAVTIGVTQLFFASIVSDLSFKASMLAGLIVLFITFATAWGVLQDIAIIVKRHHVTRKKRPESADSQE